MKRLWPNIYKLLGCVALVLTLPGCWDYERINYRDQILGIGIEPSNEHPKMLHFTFQVPLFAGGNSSASVESSSEDRTKSKSFQNYEVDAPDFASAISLAQTQTEKMLYLGNLQTIIFSNRLSGEQVDSVVTELIRDPATDKLGYILETSDSPEKILSTSIRDIPATFIHSFMDTGVKQYAYTERTHLWEFWRDSVAIGIVPKCALIRIEDNQIVMKGLMALPHFQAKVALIGEEAIGYNAAMGRIDRYYMNVQDGPRAIALGNVRVKSKLQTIYHAGHPILRIQMSVKANLVSDESYGKQSVDLSILHQYERLTSRNLTEQVKKTLQQLQKNHADIYGFGRYALIQDPHREQVLIQHWDEMFASGKPEIQCNVHIRRKGTLV